MLQYCNLNRHKWSELWFTDLAIDSVFGVLEYFIQICTKCQVKRFIKYTSETQFQINLINKLEKLNDYNN